MAAVEDYPKNYRNMRMKCKNRTTNFVKDPNLAGHSGPKDWISGRCGLFMTPSKAGESVEISDSFISTEIMKSDYTSEINTSGINSK
jgi:hypothetical protein